MDVDERLFGSRSYEFVDVASCLLYSQLEVTTRSQAKQQIVLLQEVVRKLKGHFNGIFDELYEFKNEKMRQINDWREALKSVLNELGTIHILRNYFEEKGGGVKNVDFFYFLYFIYAWEAFNNCVDKKRWVRGQLKVHA